MMDASRAAFGWRRCLGVGAVLGSLALVAAAQTPGAIRPVIPTPEELAPKAAPPSSDQQELPKRPAPPRELAKPQEELSLDVRRYTVSDRAPAQLIAALPVLTAPYVGPRRSYEDLVNAAAEVTRYLQRDLGYYLGYAYIPEQAPRDGVIRIEILEGRLDRVELVWRDDLPVKREVVEGYLKALRPGEILRVRDLERVVFLVNDLRGINARFEVTAGSQPGTATLVVTPQPEPRYSGRVDLDDYGARYLGQARAGVLGYANSLFGLGDSLTANLLASKGLQFALVGVNLPVGSDGVRLGATVSAVRYRLSGLPIEAKGDATSISAYGLYPWIRSRNLNLFMLGTLDANRYTDRTLVETHKTIRRVVFGLTGDLRDSVAGGAVNTFDANVTRGRVGYAGGAPSGLDDSPSFTKLVLGFNRLQNLLEGRWLLYLSLRAQRALANLDVNEQFRIGGPDAVRAFAPGEGSADSGEVATIELRLLPPESVFGRVARELVGSVFYDAGWVSFRHDRSQRPASFVNSASYGGAGLAVSWERPGQYALRASVAKPVHGVPTSDAPRSVRFYLQLTRAF